MSKFKLQKDGFTSATSIPNCFIEQYMPKAAGEFVKIYIYLLKCVEENRSELSISKIADALENSEKDIIRALKYWQKRGILKLTFDEDNVLTSLSLNALSENGGRDFDADEIAVAGKAALPADKAVFASNTEAKARDAGTDSVSKEKKEYSADEIKALSNKEDITQLIYIIQKYLGHTLSSSELNTLLFFYDTLKFPVDVIEYLFEYCVSKGHKSMRYIEKVALSWDEQEIRSLKAAKTLNGIYSDNCYPVLKAFGLSGRAPVKGESDFVAKWTLSYGFDIDIILEACNRTINSIHQPSFEYADSILKRWKASGVTSLEEIKELDNARDAALAKSEKTNIRKKSSLKDSGSGGSSSNKFNNFTQRQYDYIQLEKKLFKV